AGYELKENDKLLQDRLYINDGNGNFSKDQQALPTMLTSGKSVSAGDFDNDGDLDLFVGGNVVPGKYPLAPNSYLLENNNGKFVDQTSKHPELQNIGMVSEAIFTDYDNDQDQDLFIVGEWMAPTIFSNNNGIFTKTSIAAFEKNEGWWFSINAGDFDNDGDQDYVLGNIGLNNKFQPKKDKPIYIYSKDFDNNGTYDVALTKINDGKLVPVRGKECSSQQNPFLLDKIGSYKEFASLEFKDIYGEDRLKGAHKLVVHNFASVYVENNGDGTFSISKLANEAQVGPTLASISRDINNDGNLDILGVGAIYDAEVETIRYDGNQGYVLLGDGNGNFQYSNVYDPRVIGDAKDLAMLNIDGEVNFVVVSNNAPLSVFTLTP
ncbi:MAG: VCBS repeat-containing protein, partial [Flavobacteriaceae bacterium]|nr:VCBS repeat-containing protein [Flavobacteriaceae bacterium]